MHRWFAAALVMFVAIAVGFHLGFGFDPNEAVLWSGVILIAVGYGITLWGVNVLFLKPNGIRNWQAFSEMLAGASIASIGFVAMCAAPLTLLVGISLILTVFASFACLKDAVHVKWAMTVLGPLLGAFLGSLTLIQGSFSFWPTLVSSVLMGVCWAAPFASNAGKPEASKSYY